MAVIDSGVEDHKDLVLDDDTENSAEAQANIDNAKAFIEKNGYGTQVSDKIVFAYNYAANDSDATGTSGVDHGEHVAGIIAANGHTNLTAEQIAAEQTESTPDHTQARNAWLAVIQKVVANSEADANEGIPTDDEDQASKDAQDFIDQFNNSLGSDDDDDDSATGATDTTQSLTNVKIAALAKALAAAADDTTTDTAADPQTDAYSVGVAPEAQILDLRVIANNPQKQLVWPKLFMMPLL